MVLFSDTNDGCNTRTSNPLALNYAPLQELALDLANNTVADDNWITPDQYNAQHSTLANGYGVAYTLVDALMRKLLSFGSVAKW
jgi:hypothetical protein